MKAVTLLFLALMLSGCTGLTAADEAWIGVFGDRCSASIDKSCRR